MPTNPPDARDFRNLANELKETRKALVALNNTLVEIERRRRAEKDGVKFIGTLCNDCDKDLCGRSFTEACTCCRMNHIAPPIPHTGQEPT